MTLRSAHETSVGLRRDNNEDALLDSRGLYAVADGIGGHPAGEVASTVAINTLRDLLVDFRAAVNIDVLRATFAQAHADLLDLGMRNPARHRMGTTLTALAIADGKAVIAHVGDSRLYLVRGRIGLQITADDAGAWGSLANCLGNTPDSHTHTAVVEQPVEPGDLFVLCTDGVSRYADAEKVARLADHAREIVEGTRNFPLVDALAETLVQFALRSGGRDNATAVVVEIS